ncbi:MAG: VCBS repeat-containing protein [Terriglobales bacterium]
MNRLEFVARSVVILSVGLPAFFSLLAVSQTPALVNQSTSGHHSFSTTEELKVLDLRPAAVSLLNPPIIHRIATARWDPQNIRGVVVLESAGNGAKLRYPNGLQYFLPSNLYSPSSRPIIASDEKTGTLTVRSGRSGFPPRLEDPKSWSIQLPTDNMRDINGDGWPEVVITDYSGGAHCCTDLTVLSLRPKGPVCIFSQKLGSASAELSDLDSDGKMEIVTTRLEEYALGTFAFGTYGVPVIYAAGSDGVYRVDTRAFQDVLRGDLDKELAEISTRGVDITYEEQNTRRIDLFFLKYLINEKTEAYAQLKEITPYVQVSVPEILGIVKRTLKTVAPEVLTEPEWIQLSNQR